MRIIIAASLLLLAGISTSHAQQASGDVEAGKVRSYTCSGCHGIPDYNNVYPTFRVPKVAGQNYVYLVNALNAYKEGTRKHPTMNVQAKSMTEQDIANVSAYFASLGDEVEPAAVSENTEEKAAVCQSCHGPDGNQSITPDIPVLAGQHQDYLEHALSAYRSGDRQQAVMSTFAGQLSDQDIEDLAEYYADQNGDLKDLSIN